MQSASMQQKQQKLLEQQGIMAPTSVASSVGASGESSTHVVVQPLTDVNVPLETIQPGESKVITLELSFNVHALPAWQIVRYQRLKGKSKDLFTVSDEAVRSIES